MNKQQRELPKNWPKPLARSLPFGGSTEYGKVPRLVKRFGASMMRRFEAEVCGSARDPKTNIEVPMGMD